jgi:hypothetical protein
MTRCQACPDVDWESFWSSYTFASADPSGQVVAAPSMFEPGSPWKLRIAVGGAVVALIAGGYLLQRLRRRAGARSESAGGS